MKSASTPDLPILLLLSIERRLKEKNLSLFFEKLIFNFLKELKTAELTPMDRIFLLNFESICRLIYDNFQHSFPLIQIFADNHTPVCSASKLFLSDAY